MAFFFTIGVKKRENVNAKEKKYVPLQRREIDTLLTLS